MAETASPFDGVAGGGRAVSPVPADELEHLDPFDEAPDGGLAGGRAVGGAVGGAVAGGVEASPLRRGRLPAGAIALMVIAAAAIVLVMLGRHGHPVAGRQLTPTTAAPSATTFPATQAVGPAGGETTVVPTTEVVPSAYAHLIDLTWISDARGFALISVNCPTGTCAMILTTSDGGQSWTRGGNVPDVSGQILGQACIANCFEHLRYASPAVGYLWGQAGLYLTVDGGQTWASQPASEIAALEALPQGVAVRIAAPGATPGQITGQFEVDRAPVGSGQWSLRAKQAGFFGAAIVTAGKYLYIAWEGRTGGGAPDAHTAFMRSADGGVTWQSFGDPCGKTSDGSELDATAFAATPNGDLGVLCTPRLVNGTLWYTESLDSGDNFGTLQPVPLDTGMTPELALADSGRVALVATIGSASTEVIRSADGGRSWATVLAAPPPAMQGSVPWLGFEDETTGRVSFGDPQLWTTSDSGLTWTEEQVPTSA